MRCTEDKKSLAATYVMSEFSEKGRNQIGNTQPHFLETEKEGVIHPWPIQACLCGLRSLSWILLASCLILYLGFD